MVGHGRNETTAVRSSMKRYYWTFGPAMVLYVVGTMGLFVSEGRSTAVQLGLAAIPIVGVVWVTAALLGLYRRSDELLRAQMVKGAAAGFAVGIPALAISGLVFSFLDEPSGRASIVAVWLPFTVAMLAWAVGWARSQKVVMH